MGTSRPKVVHGVAVALVAGVVAGSGAWVGSSQPEMPDEAAIQKWIESTKPNDRHRFLEQFVGEWDTTMKMYWDPAGEPMVTRGTCTYTMMHGGRFLRLDTKSKMVMPTPAGEMQEIDMTGLGITGFDNIKNQYVMSWTDSLSTAIYTGKGGMSPDGKSVTFFGEMDEPLTGEMGKTIKYVLRVIDADRHTFEVYEVLYGEPFKVVEIEYARRR